MFASDWRENDVLNLIKSSPEDGVNLNDISSIKWHQEDQPTQDFLFRQRQRTNKSVNLEFSCFTGLQRHRPRHSLKTNSWHVCLPDHHHQNFINIPVGHFVSETTIGTRCEVGGHQTITCTP